MKSTTESNNLVADLIDQNFGRRDGEFTIDGMPVSDLAREYGTPLYLYSKSVLMGQIALLKKALPARFSVFYSVKANPNQQILRCVLEEGCGLEVASLGELVQATSAGCSPEKIVFAGPGKTEYELAEAVRRQIGEIHVESATEIQRLAEIGREQEQPISIGIRVNPSGAIEGGALRMGGRPTPFGVDEEQLDEMIDLILKQESLLLAGLHIYAGTQILDAEQLDRQYGHAIEIAKRITARTERPLATIDFGGGLGIPYFAHETTLDVARLGKLLAALDDRLVSELLLKDVTCILEPGRFLVGPAGIYVTRVNDVKMSREKKFVVVDGGMHHHLAASGNLGQTIRRNFPIAVLDRTEGDEVETVDIVGPLCTPLDTLGRNVQLPAVQIGDLIGVFQAGAYALSASPMGFLSHPSPAEVLIGQDGPRMIRRRGRIEDLFLGQTDLE